MTTLSLGAFCVECMGIIKEIPLTLLLGFLVSCLLGLFSLVSFTRRIEAMVC